MVLKLVKFTVPRRLFSTESMKTQIGVVGIPYNRGSSKKPGTELAPNVIRQSGFIKETQEFYPNIDIKDFGDVPMKDIRQTLDSMPKNMLNYSGLMPLMNRISEKIQEIRAENRICIALGGDHTIAIGSFRILSFANPIGSRFGVLVSLYLFCSRQKAPFLDI